MFMKSVSAASAALIMLAAIGLANAADLPAAPVYKAPAAIAPAHNWTGFYIGGHFGYGWAKPTVWNPTTGGPFADPLPAPTGVLGGAQGGYNYQIGNWVLGLEADITWTDVKGSATCVNFACSAGALHVFGYPDWFGTLTGRFGYSFDRFLVFGKGGFSLMHEYFEQTGIPPNTFCVPTCSGTNINTGWTVGGGVEYALTNNWSVKAEYNYMTDLDRKRTTLTNSIGTLQIFDEVRQIQTLKFGVNYKFY